MQMSNETEPIDSIALAAAVRAHLVTALLADGVPPELVDGSRVDSHPFAVRITRPRPRPVTLLVTAVGPNFYNISCGESSEACYCGSGLIPGYRVAGALTDWCDDCDGGLS